MEVDLKYLVTKKKKLEKEFIKMYISLGFVKGKTLKQMVNCICDHYNDILFHNILHVYEVCVFLFDLMKHIRTYNNSKTGQLKRLCFFAAMCHDIGHRGWTNQNRCSSGKSSRFHIPLDIEEEYIISETSFNENIHVTLATKVYKEFFTCFNIDKQYNITLFLNNVILSTDILLHSHVMTYINKLEICDNTTNLLQKPITSAILILKLSDLSHTMKPFKIHCNWVLKLKSETNAEFTNIKDIAIASIGFMESYVEPLIEKMDSHLYKSNKFKILLQRNKIIWTNYLLDTHTTITNKSKNENKQLNIIDRISCSNENDDIACTIHDNACICMIDIVNFSQWCSKQNPIFIFETMTQYNNFLNEKINNYEYIEKVELVGDSVMIVGGLYSDKKQTLQYTKCVIHLCYSILSDLTTLQNIFNDNTISLRIGVHNGDVYSGYIMYPKKYQLFGNSINIASRLESSCIPGTLNISLQTYSIIKQDDLNSKFNVGKTKSNFLKGVGLVHSKMCFIRISKVLIADDVLSTCKILEYKIKDIECDIITDYKDCFEILKKKYYNVVFLDRYFEDEDVYNELVNFRIWESKYKNNYQKIYLMTTIEPNENYNKFKLYVDDVIDKKTNFHENIKKHIDQNNKDQIIDSHT